MTISVSVTIWAIVTISVSVTIWVIVTISVSVTIWVIVTILVILLRIAHLSFWSLVASKVG